MKENNSMIKKEKDVALAVERLKEREILRYEEMMAKNGGEIDARETSLQFMYAIPKPKEGKDGKLEKGVKMEQVQINVGEEDSAVLDFKRMFKKNGEDDRNVRQKIEGALEQEPHEYGEKKNRRDITMKERFPFLKNAPVEGDLAQSTNEIRHKPFNKVIYNVQCTRCGQWGHRSGDRECELKGANPNDYSRLKREDPMQYFVDEDNNISKKEEEGGDDDPEVRFLNSLTSREKKLLIRKLKSKIVLTS